jgi:cytochrome b561
MAMMWRNSPERWGAIAQLLHWGIAVMVIGLAIVGLTMDELPNSPTKMQVYALHKSTGLTVLVLVVLRLIWRLVDRRPPYPPTMARWQQQLAALTHGLLYALLLSMPLSGWLYNSASNFPLRWFGLFPVPSLSGPDRELKHFAHEVHETGFYVLAALFALHVGAALLHHYRYRDATLVRMLPGRHTPPSTGT